MKENVKGEIMTDYIHIDRHEKSRNALIIFSHVDYPAGKFAMTSALKDFPINKIFVNCHDNSWYQQGVPGVSDTIDGTTAYLAKLLKDMRIKRSATVGMSMGAYASLLFGIKLGCTAVLSITPEISVGQDYGRSYKLNKLRKYDYQYADLSRLIRENKKTRIYSIYGAYDDIDMSFLWTISDVMERNEWYKPFFLSGEHTVTYKLDVVDICSKLVTKWKLHNEDVSRELLLTNSFSQKELMLQREVKRYEKEPARIYDVLAANIHKPSPLSLAFARACIDTKRTNEAIEVLQELTKQDPDCYSGFHLLGLAFQISGDLDKAKMAYSRAMEIEDRAATTSFRLGVVCKDLDQPEEAGAHLRHALDINPSYEEAEKQLNALSAQTR
jgi:hypothetical protein